MTAVSLAIPTDESALLEALAMKHHEDGFGKFDHAKVREVIRRGITREFAMIGVIRGPHGIEATIGLFIGTLWTSPDQHISDLWHFVAPDYRKSTHGKALIEFAKWASGELERPLMMMTVKNEKTAKKVDLYERQLGPATGFMFTYQRATVAA